MHERTDLATLAPLVNGILDEIVGGERADRALARGLKANRQLSSEERRHVAEWTLGIALWRGRLDFMASDDRSLWLGLFLVDREGRTVPEAARISGADTARLERGLQTPPPTDPVARLAFERSLPRWLAERWVQLWGVERADRLAAAMNERGPIAVRTNLLRTTRDELLAELKHEGVSTRVSSLVETGIILEGRPNILGLDAWRCGLFEVQDEGSQLIAQAVAAQSGEVIVDLCAGSGGKTLALAAAMGNRGRLIACDVDAQRLVDLRVRAQRGGVSCIQTRNCDARDPAPLVDLAGRADAVLIDAPCSAVGTLRRGPDARWRLAVNESEQWVSMQVALLHVGAGLVRPGGRLVYATCSLDPSENQDVSRTLDRSRFRLVHERTVSPDVERCDGFYWALFNRTTSS